jgi:hypothetical protein
MVNYQMLQQNQSKFKIAQTHFNPFPLLPNHESVKFLEFSGGGDRKLLKRQEESKDTGCSFGT